MANTASMMDVAIGWKVLCLGYYYQFGKEVIKLKLQFEGRIIDGNQLGHITVQASATEGKFDVVAMSHPEPLVLKTYDTEDAAKSGVADVADKLRELGIEVIDAR